jgi:hypothetical protein
LYPLHALALLHLPQSTVASSPYALYCYRYNPPGNYWRGYSTNIFPRSNSTIDLNPPSPSPKPPAANPSPSPSPDLPENPKPSPKPPPPGGNPRNFQLGSVLQAGWYMSVESESCMTASNKKYRMCISGPGNVTVIQVRPRKVLWASNTKIRRGTEFPAKLWLDDDNVLQGEQRCRCDWGEIVMRKRTQYIGSQLEVARLPDTMPAVACAVTIEQVHDCQLKLQFDAVTHTRYAQANLAISPTAQ